MSIFSDRLRELRGNESQASFAAEIGLNRVQYAKYESSKNAPSIDVLATICRTHACSADWLLGLPERGKSASPPKCAAKPPDCASCKFKRFAEAFKAIQAPI